MATLPKASLHETMGTFWQHCQKVQIDATGAAFDNFVRSGFLDRQGRILSVESGLTTLSNPIFVLPAILPKVHNSLLARDAHHAVSQNRLKPLSRDRKAALSAPKGPFVAPGPSPASPCPATPPTAHTTPRVGIFYFREERCHTKQNHSLTNQIFGIGQYRYRNGQLYFVHGKSRIKVTEHFSSAGKKMDLLIQDLIQFSAQQREDGPHQTVRE